MIFYLWEEYFLTANRNFSDRKQKHFSLQAEKVKDK